MKYRRKVENVRGRVKKTVDFGGGVGNVRWERRQEGGKGGTEGRKEEGGGACSSSYQLVSCQQPIENRKVHAHTQAHTENPHRTAPSQSVRN